MTRVAAVIDSLGLGGAERLLVTLAGHAAAGGIELSVLSLREGTSSMVADQLEGAGADVRYVPTSSQHHLTDPRRVLRLSRQLRALDVDVVHTHLGTAHVVGIAAARLAARPVVATLHSIRRPDGGLRDRVILAALRQADVIVAVGQEVARTHVPILTTRPITVVPNPVDVDACTAWGPDTAAVRRTLLDGQTGPLLLSVGRLESPKGHLLLLDALRLVVDRYPGTVLAIAGDGSLRAEVEAKAATLRMADHLRVLGARQDVPDLLAAADLFVNPSHWEGLPLAVLEAMAAGRAVVATDVGDVREVVGDAGIVVPPGHATALASAIDVLLQDGDRRMRLAARGRAIVAARYDPDRWVVRLHDVYDDACAHHRGAA